MGYLRCTGWGWFIMHVEVWHCGMKRKGICGCDEWLCLVQWVPSCTILGVIIIILIICDAVKRINSILNAILSTRCHLNSALLLCHCIKIHLMFRRNRTKPNNTTFISLFYRKSIKYHPLFHQLPSAIFSS